jgi:hypothetical protein
MEQDLYEVTCMLERKYVPTFMNPKDTLRIHYIEPRWIRSDAIRLMNSQNSFFPMVS